MSIHVYWGQLFILPKSFLKKVGSIYRCFLWYGMTNDRRSGAIDWDVLCKFKSSSGLGFRNILSWNVITISKLAYFIAQKKDNMWIKWVNYIYIKDADWSNYEAPQHASWA